ncbi:hypothetical protein ACFO9Q_04900 [Paenibacillus sp. GCM10023252]|uniref:hypothetical protein n=1 Tax=Paenibacillus sp. GCM10023252 TaxID=3252649 RepID=UPI00362234FA
MKIKLSCRQCQIDRFQLIDLSDGIYYKYECKYGHKNNVILQEWKFEILFEMALMALKDGYTREAVSSFAASLERFYEYIIELIVIHSEIDSNQFSDSWKLMSTQSERQLGAFYTAFLLHFKETPKALNPKLTEFRNKIIHKGYIPTTEEVINYGRELFKYVVEILKKFDLKEYMPSILKMTKKIRKSINIDYSYGLICIVPVPVGLKHHFPHILEDLDFDELLKSKNEFEVMKGSFE